MVVEVVAICDFRVACQTLFLPTTTHWSADLPTTLRAPTIAHGDPLTRASTGRQFAPTTEISAIAHRVTRGAVLLIAFTIQ